MQQGWLHNATNRPTGCKNQHDAKTNTMQQSWTHDANQTDLNDAKINMMQRPIRCSRAGLTMQTNRPTGCKNQHDAKTNTMQQSWTHDANQTDLNDSVVTMVQRST
jgi:hypothetical protein